MEEDNEIDKLKRGIINELKYLNDLRSSTNSTEELIMISELKVRLYDIMSYIQVE